MRPTGGTTSQRPLRNLQSGHPPAASPESANRTVQIPGDMSETAVHIIFAVEPEFRVPPLLLIPGGSSLLYFQATRKLESRLVVTPSGQSTALNVERKPGFGRMDAAESHSRARTVRLWRSARLTNEVREPRSGARTAERGHNQPALTSDYANNTA
ncbi:hypothetical protein JOE09_002829 [Pantoea coffeiphila]|nr:hypothetical protein [Pantoea coffeiphila]